MSVDLQKKMIWLDGKFIEWDDAKIHVLSPTLHYGIGVFEGIRAYDTPNGPAIFRLSDHIKRLFQSAHILAIRHDFKMETLLHASIDLLKINHLQNGYIRPLLYLGAESLGLHSRNVTCHAMMAAWSWKGYLGATAIERGVRVRISSFTRHHVNSALCKAKASGNYLNSALAAKEAASLGADEALLLDKDGYVCEGSGENIFLIRNGTLYTPDLTSVLEGITRDTVFHIAEDLKVSVIEKRITRDELYIADEIFLTGTAAEITPVYEVDGRQIGTGQPGPLTQIIQKQYFKIVHGNDPRHFEWLTYV